MEIIFIAIPDDTDVTYSGVSVSFKKMVCLLCQISNEAGASPRKNRPLQIETQYQDKTVIVQVSDAPKHNLFLQELSYFCSLL